VSKCLNLYLDYPKRDLLFVVMSLFLLHNVIPAFGHPNLDLAVPICLGHYSVSEFGHPILSGSLYYSNAQKLLLCVTPYFNV
jgi:hypothetical protein